jgi:hypothetical protein
MERRFNAGLAAAIAAFAVAFACVTDAHASYRARGGTGGFLSWFAELFGADESKVVADVDRGAALDPNGRT